MSSTIRHAVLGGLALLAVTLIAIALGLLNIEGGSREPAAGPLARRPAPALPSQRASRAPGRFSRAELRQIRRDQRRARHGQGEVDSAVERDEAKRRLAADAGALARALPLRSGPWQLRLQSASAEKGVYVVSVIPLDGSRLTIGRARQIVRTQARRIGDDPHGYEAVVPMSALRGAHEHTSSSRPSAGRSGRRV